MRAALFVVWALAALAVAWPRLRPRSGASDGTSARDELVKDPVCQTYVVRSRAIRRILGGESRYFCSRDCASRYSAS